MGAVLAENEFYFFDHHRIQLSATTPTGTGATSDPLLVFWTWHCRSALQKKINALKALGMQVHSLQLPRTTFSADLVLRDLQLFACHELARYNKSLRDVHSKRNRGNFIVWTPWKLSQPGSPDKWTFTCRRTLTLSSFTSIQVPGRTACGFLIDSASTRGARQMTDLCHCRFWVPTRVRGI